MPPQYKLATYSMRRFGDCIYCIHRVYDDRTEVVYVLVNPGDLIPNLSTLPAANMLSVLTAFPECADDSWTTLFIYRDAENTRAKRDAFQPHRLDDSMVLGNYPLFDYIGLPLLTTYQNKVERVLLNGQRCFLKLARSHTDIPAIGHEIRAYHALMQRRATAAPKLLGYAYEGTRHRVVGFFCEEVVGHYPTFRDIHVCDRALNQLHNLGIEHGDINRYNILVTHDGRRAKFIDFERSRIRPIAAGSQWEDEKADESRELLSELTADFDNLQPPRTWTNSLPSGGRWV